MIIIVSRSALGNNKSNKNVDAVQRGGVRGVQTWKNCPEICTYKHCQNNIRKPQATWFCKTTLPQLKIKMSAKPHQKSSKTASLQTLTSPDCPHFNSYLM